MKELETQIIKNGFMYEQVYKGTEGYIYAQMHNGSIISFEAFQRKENRRFNCISFPGNEVFGKWAWSCRSLSAAKDRLGIKEFPIDLPE